MSQEGSNYDKKVTQPMPETKKMTQWYWDVAMDFCQVAMAGVDSTQIICGQHDRGQGRIDVIRTKLYKKFWSGSILTSKVVQNWYHCIFLRDTNLMALIMLDK